MRKLKDAIAKKSKPLLEEATELREANPIRQPEYFHDCYDQDAAKESNRLAGRSVQKLVK